MTHTDSRIACESDQFAIDLMQRKATLRNVLMNARNALPQAVRAVASAALGRYLLEWLEGCRCAALAVYWPIRGEPDLMDTYRKLMQSGLQLALPVVIAPDAPLAFAAWVPGQPMTRDGFGVAIPSGPHQLVRPDVILIPCVGFTPQRIRLGYGGGFYDRTLAAMPATTAVGIAFDCAKAVFCAAPHDIGLQAVITESGIF